MLVRRVGLKIGPRSLERQFKVTGLLTLLWVGIPFPNGMVLRTFEIFDINVGSGMFSGSVSPMIVGVVGNGVILML